MNSIRDDVNNKIIGGKIMKMTNIEIIKNEKIVTTFEDNKKVKVERYELNENGEYVLVEIETNDSLTLRASF